LGWLILFTLLSYQRNSKKSITESTSSSTLPAVKTAGYCRSPLPGLEEQRPGRDSMKIAWRFIQRRARFRGSTQPDTTFPRIFVESAAEKISVVLSVKSKAMFFQAGS
jgi:hypothetical protein